MNTITNIAIFASGSGSNAQKIMGYFQGSENIRVKYLLSNNKEAYALERAEKMGIETKIFNRRAFRESDEIVEFLVNNEVSWVILAGFLWMIPENLIKAFPHRIINIHPALLPLYGGKGMYGMHVHTAVHKAKDKESGISIHLVNENYDEGEIIFQAKCLLDENDTPESIAEKVLKLEHEYFPKVIETLIKKSL
ncbi:MAG TPA: phosphoribosylglycinamide formyltransferase [Cytophagaceae bacterium]|jgi:phosphoribosylglycinamide formyltransferase-1|nr:phosphoribosylglycinamide formyltransferase [Cytophagaceae bacterium]